ncbi:MAG: hypothetical protein KC422_24070 [Trueperaceae bacterium]|nr:hypothetical protein [Trueperaceae bacterium]
MTYSYIFLEQPFSDLLNQAEEHKAQIEKLTLEPNSLELLYALLQMVDQRVDQAVTEIMNSKVFSDQVNQIKKVIHFLQDFQTELERSNTSEYPIQK